VGDAQSRSLFIGKPFAREVKVAERAEQFAAGDSTRRLHLGSLRSPSVRLAGVAPDLNAGRWGNLETIMTILGTTS
jgi:hypothetical protein